MRERRRSDQERVRLMLRAAGEARPYLDRWGGHYDDPETPYFRQGLWALVYQFVESTDRVSETFKAANPAVPWALYRRFRFEMARDYPEVSPGRVFAFARDAILPAVPKLRRARFPKG